MTITSLESARGRLAAVWFAGSGTVFLILVAQSLGGIYAGELDKAWAWALPTIVPTLSLMISVFASYALISEAEEDIYTVRKNFLLIAMSLSVFYIGNVIIVVAAAPFSLSSTASPDGNVTDILHISNFWLGPLQGLTAASLAALFFTKSDNKKSALSPIDTNNTVPPSHMTTETTSE